MAFNGSGTYALYTPGNPVVSGTTIDASWANNTLPDIATALTLCITKDGQQTTTASIPFVLGIAVTTAITTPSTTFALVNTTATTVNFAGGASTALNMGHASGTTTIAGATTIAAGTFTVTAGTVTTGATTALSLGTTGGTGIRSYNTASAVNYFAVTPGATGNAVLCIAGTATDTNVALQLSSRGAGEIQFYTNSSTDGGASAVLQAHFSNTAGSSRIVNGIRIGADSSNNLLDDATNGAGTATLWIGNSSIDVTVSDERLKSNRVEAGEIAPKHLKILARLLEEYDLQKDGRFAGHVAQRLEKELPQYVIRGTNPEDNWSVKYKYMVGPLLWGWHDHESRLAALERA